MTSKSPVWHPFTQHAVPPEATLISRGEGAWLEAADGRRIFDAISSWWVVTHGHRHPHIVQAIKDQTDKLDQVIFAGFTHEPAEKLARHLVAITSPELEYVFFSDSGSTSVEVALKWRWAIGGISVPSEAVFLRWKVPITATPSAECRSVNVVCSTRLTIRCCSTLSGFPFLALAAS